MRTKTSQFLGEKGRKTAPHITRYNYDPKGRLQEAHNNAHYIGFKHNALGNIVKEQHCDLNAQHQRMAHTLRETEYTHVWPGVLSGIQLPDGNQIHYGFDKHNQLTGVAYNGDIISQIERDAFGRETTRHQGALSTHTEYDPAGRLANQTSTNQLNKTQGPIQREYGYDVFGNISQLTESTGDTETQTRYVYDLINRLERVEGDHPETFTFDPASNILAIDQSKNNRSHDQGRHSQTDGNRLLMQGDKKFTYDKRGNLIQENRGKDGKLVTRYTYNANNQLVQLDKNGQTTTTRSADAPKNATNLAPPTTTGQATNSPKKPAAKTKKPTSTSQTPFGPWQWYKTTRYTTTT